MKDSFGEFWFVFRRSKGAVIGLGFISLMLFTALFPFLISSHDPTDQFRDSLLAPPLWMEGGSPRFLLGTDALGRDVFSRIVHGASYSMFIGFFVVLLSMSVGIAVGLLTGYFGGWLDVAVTRLMDIVLAFPSLLLALVMVAIFGPGLVNAMIAIAVIQLPHFVRLTRGQVLQEKSKDYYAAAKIMGMGHFRIMLFQLLPNCLSPLIVQATLNFSNAILDAAALGFLGLGAQPPTPEWGTLLAESREFILRAWWVITFPGLAILFTTLAVNLVGDGMRDALDPKLKAR